MQASTVIILAAALTGAFGVAGAAYAAHGGDARLIGTAAGIALVHAPALLAVGLAAGRSRALAVTAALWALGTLLFGGDLALRALAGSELFPSAAPFGGVLLIVGWLSLAIAAVRLRGR